MKLTQIILVATFTVSFVNADDIKFIVRNETGKSVRFDFTKLGHCAELKGVPVTEIAADGKAEIVLSVRPELFDVNNKEKIVLFIDNYRIIDIAIDFPVGSALLSAIAHDIANSGNCSQSISFKSNQICGQSTRWQNIVYIRPRSTK
ncbi:MAG: hypothetical protein LBT90_02890 [Holosporaceae bacterium]|jgi:hypothetical protein|nr:hypothetical protein [Holosporaceae bacterium]